MQFFGCASPPLGEIDTNGCLALVGRDVLDAVRVVHATGAGRQRLNAIGGEAVDAGTRKRAALRVALGFCAIFQAITILQAARSRRWRAIDVRAGHVLALKAPSSGVTFRD